MLWVTLCLAHGCRGGKSLWVFQKERGTGWSYQATSLPCGLLSVRWILCAPALTSLSKGVLPALPTKPFPPRFLHSMTYIAAVWELRIFSATEGETASSGQFTSSVDRLLESETRLWLAEHSHP